MGNVTKKRTTPLKLILHGRAIYTKQRPTRFSNRLLLLDFWTMYDGSRILSEFKSLQEVEHINSFIPRLGTRLR